MVTVVVNNLVRLECEARGIPAPILTWLKDGSPVSSFSDGLQVLGSHRAVCAASSCGRRLLNWCRLMEQSKREVLE